MVDKLRQRVRDHLQRLSEEDPFLAGELTRFLEEHETYETELEIRNEELRQITHDIEESQDQYLRLYDAIPSGFLTLDDQLKIKRVNRSALTLLGRPADKLLDRPFPLLVHSDDRSAFVRLIKAGRQSADKKNIQTEIRVSADGRDFVPVLLELRSGADQAEKTDYWLVSLTDISRVKDAERQLQLAHDQLEAQVEERTRQLSARNEILETIVDNIPVMIVFYDTAGKVSYVNPATEQLLKMDLKQMQQIDLMAHLYPEPAYREKVLAFMKRADGKWKDLGMTIRDGRRQETSWANIRLSGGSYIGIGIDISRRKQAEKLIEQYLAELEWKNRELKDFTLVASHDLQEPLRKIQAFGDMLQKELPETGTETSRDYLSRIIVAAERMQQLIKALLNYSRVSSKARSFRRIDLHKIVETVIDDMDTLDNHEKPVFEVGKMDRIEADEVQMRQLLQNLFANSINYVKPGETPRIAITTRRVKPIENSKRVFCEIRVQDNGIGFDIQYLDKIFQPFERLHSCRDYSGTGMGLAICRKIAQRHSGFITAESTPGQGAVFILTIPVRQTNHERNRTENPVYGRPGD